MSRSYTAQQLPLNLVVSPNDRETVVIFELTICPSLNAQNNENLRYVVLGEAMGEDQGVTPRLPSSLFKGGFFSFRKEWHVGGDAFSRKRRI